MPSLDDLPVSVVASALLALPPESASCG